MIKVLQPGLHTSIQDLGRFHYRNFGVPVSGVMDEYHAKLANQILGNDENVPVLEITLQGPILEFYVATQIVICGADLSPKLNKQPLRLNILVNIKKGDILEFGRPIYGVRAYLAVKNGFQVAEVLKSCSYYEGITQQSRIQTGDVLLNQEYEGTVQSKAHIAVQKALFTSNELDVYEGSEFDFLSKKQQEQLVHTEFTIGLNNRMAYQLEELIKNDCPSIITSAVLPGTVQLTPSGKLIILMKDCQTTGGYPRVLQLTEKSIMQLAQKRTKDRIRFKKLSIL
jgi:biotin-dependent carboxylase-like uncharacterized protein